MAVYSVTITAIKISVLLFYFRIFGVRPDVRIAIYAIGALVVIWGIVAFFLSIFQCTARARTIPGAHCMSTFKFFLGTAIPNTLLDISLLVLPLRVLWTLQLSTQKRIALSTIFSVGLL